jgi:hypothetical protein
MQPNDAGATTIKGYLLALLDSVWYEEEGFDGKRPFGNSGWKHEVYQVLGKAGLIQITMGEYDGETFYDGTDEDEEADKLIMEAIRSL